MRVLPLLPSSVPCVSVQAEVFGPLDLAASPTERFQNDPREASRLRTTVHLLLSSGQKSRRVDENGWILLIYRVSPPANTPFANTTDRKCMAAGGGHKNAVHIQCNA